MSRARPGASVTLSMRERAEVDTLYARVLAGEHYRVLGVPVDAPPDEVQKAYLRLTRWLDTLQHPDRDLGTHRARVDVVAAAVENALRIVGNPRERLLYDGQRASSPGRTQTTPRRESPPLLPPSPPFPVSPGNPQTARGPTTLRAHDAVQRPSAWHGADGHPASTKALGAAASQLIDLLDAHLGEALGRDVSLRDAAGGAFNLDDSVRYARRAEDAEQAGRWGDAAIHWHLASLAAPDDSTMVLRAATALRWAGASTSLFDRYTRLVRDQDLLSPSHGENPPGGSPPGGSPPGGAPPGGHPRGARVPGTVPSGGSPSGKAQSRRPPRR